MPQDVPQEQKTSWAVFNAGQYGQFRADIASAFRWLIQTLDETEDRNHLPRSRFDQPLQSRTRRAS